jgi:hypothetical protein
MILMAKVRSNIKFDGKIIYIYANQQKLKPVGPTIT